MLSFIALGARDLIAPLAFGLIKAGVPLIKGSENFFGIPGHWHGTVKTTKTPATGHHIFEVRRSKSNRAAQDALGILQFAFLVANEGEILQEGNVERASLR